MGQCKDRVAGVLDISFFAGSMPRFCQHGKDRRYCKKSEYIAKATAICPHGREKARCKEPECHCSTILFCFLIVYHFVCMSVCLKSVSAVVARIGDQSLFVALGIRSLDFRVVGFRGITG